MREAFGRVLARRSRVGRRLAAVRHLGHGRLRGPARRRLARPGRRLAERRALVAAGDPPGAPLAPGEAVRVMTGAPIPPGHRGRRSRRAGSPRATAPSSSTIAPRGRRPRAPPRRERRRGHSAALARAAAVGGRGRARRAGRRRPAARSARRPRIAIAVTGNELVPPRAAPGPGPAARLERADARRALRLARLRGHARRGRGRRGRGGPAALPRGRPGRGRPAHDGRRVRGRPGPAARARGARRVRDPLPRRRRCGRASRSPSGSATGPSGSACRETPSRRSVCFHVFVRPALDALEGADPAGPRARHRAS